jgi:hypothetical protein
MKLIPLLLVFILTSCALPKRRIYSAYEPPTKVVTVKIKKNKKELETLSFCSDTTTALLSTADPFKKILNPSPKTFETFLMRKNALLFVNPKKGKISSGHHIFELVLRSGQSFRLIEIDCHGEDKQLQLKKFSTSINQENEKHIADLQVNHIQE